MSTQLILRESMAPHPLLARVGTMESLATHFTIRSRKAGKNRDEHAERAAELEGDLAALLASITDVGIIEPLKICKIEDDDDTPRPLGAEWWIVDGRNRWYAAGSAKLAKVPATIVAASDAPAIIAATVAGRRHYSKGAAAYLACLLNPQIALDGGKRKLAALKQSPSRTECGTDLPALAFKFSVSLRLMEQAAELFRLLEGDGKPFQADAEANVWAGCGLGAVKAGVDFLIANGKAEKKAKDPAAIARAAAWQTYRGAQTKVSDLWKKWDALDDEQREAAKTGIATWIEEAPAEIRELITQSLI